MWVEPCFTRSALARAESGSAAWPDCFKPVTEQLGCCYHCTDRVVANILKQSENNVAFLSLPNRRQRGHPTTLWDRYCRTDQTAPAHDRPRTSRDLTTPLRSGRVRAAARPTAARSRWVASVGGWANPPGSQACSGDQRYWLDVQEPRGRPRTIRPSAARRNSTRVQMFCRAW